jgi:hypothetical protein
VPLARQRVNDSSTASAEAALVHRQGSPVAMEYTPDPFGKRLFSRMGVSLSQHLNALQSALVDKASRMSADEIFPITAEQVSQTLIKTT